MIRPRRRAAGPMTWPRWRAERALPWLWAAAVLLLVVLPVAGLVWRSLWVPGRAGLGLGNYAAALVEDGVALAAWHSLVIGLCSTAGALLLAVPFALLVSRTDLPGREFFRSVAVLTFAAPSFIAALGWILLLGPRGGLLNEYLLGPLGLPRLNIYGPGGIVLVLVLFLYPLIFLPVADALDNMDARLEEAAASLGASRWRVLRSVTLPLITPTVLAGAMLVFISAFAIFGPIALLGGPVGYETIPSALLRMMAFPPRIELAAVLGLPVIVLLGAILAAQHRVLGRRRFVTVAGKPARPRRWGLGVWRWPAWLFGCLVLLLSVVLPFGVLLLTSFRRAVGLPLRPENLVLFDNYRLLFAEPGMLISFWNSLWISALGALLAVALALVASWLAARGSVRWLRRVIAPAMLAPLAFPGAVLGIAAIIAYSGSPLWMGGTLGIILVAFVIRVLPQSYSYLAAGFEQLNREHEEAARSLGAGWVGTARRVLVPLLRGPLLSVGVLNFVLLFRELDISVFLYTGANPVAPVMLYQLAVESRFQLVGALSVVILAINLTVVWGVRRLTTSTW